MDMLKNIIKAFFLHGSTQMGGAFWFLVTLFEISIDYCIIDHIFKVFLGKSVQKVFVAQWIVSVVLLCIGFVCYKIEHSILGMDKVCSFYVLFHVGFTIKKYELSSKERTNFIHFVIWTVSFIFLLICNTFGTVSLSENSYNDPIFLLFVSFAGWQFVYEISFFLQNEYGGLRAPVASEYGGLRAPVASEWIAPLKSLRLSHRNREILSQKRCRFLYRHHSF